MFKSSQAMVSAEWIAFDQWRAQRTEAKLRQIERLLNEYGQSPEHDEQITLQIREKLAALRDLEKAKPPT